MKLKTGIGETSESSDAELDEKYQEGLAQCETGTCPPVSGDNCATYDFIGNTLHIPCFSGGGGSTHWLDFNIVSDDPVRMELDNSGVN